jgi:ComF family protein
MLASIVGALTGPSCLSCTQLLFHSRPLCRRCQKQWPAIGQGFRSNLFALGLYQGSLRHLVLRAKEEAMSAPATYLAHRLNQAVTEIPAHAGVFVPVPARLSRRWRGWSLPHFLARSLSHAKNGDYRPVLGRGIQSQSQSSKTGGQRRAQMKQQFFLKKTASPLKTNLSAWLVDDVCTTGATLAEARRALECRGWHCHGAVVLARVDPNQSFLEW